MVVSSVSEAHPFKIHKSLQGICSSSLTTLCQWWILPKHHLMLCNMSLLLLLLTNSHYRKRLGQSFPNSHMLTQKTRCANFISSCSSPSWRHIHTHHADVCCDFVCFKKTWWTLPPSVQTVDIVLLQLTQDYLHLEIMLSQINGRIATEMFQNKPVLT